MKKIFAATCAVATLTAGAAGAQDWSAAARQDIQAIHGLLRDNSPASAVDRDSATFKAWLDTGAAQVQALDLSKVNNAAAYQYALKAYTGGFRDANISAEMNWAPPAPWYAIGFPGFSTTWQNGGYVVAWARPGDNKIPPVGAVLVGCDKKPAETIARQRLDKFESNLDLEAGRFRSAPYLLWERANPFAGTVPLKCDFTVGGRKKSFTLNPAIAAEDERRAAFLAAAPKPTGIGLEPIDGGGFWLSLHSFADNQNWDGLVAQIEQQRDALRAAPLLVVDLRGADEGTARGGYRIVNRIWDPEFIISNTAQLGNVAYRVSPANRAFYQDVVTRLKGDPLYYYEVPRWENLVAQLDQAAASGQAILQRDETAKRPETVPANPVSGKVVVLTDYWCSAGCLDMMDLFSKLPNVTHAGVATSADTIFIGRTEAALPSGHARLAYGNKAWLDRPRGSNQPFTPAVVYTGSLADEAAVRAFAIGAAR